MTTIAPPPPAPASSPPPQLSSGGRAAIRAVLIVAATVVVLGTAGLLTAAAIGVGTTRVITDSRVLPNSMRSLAIDTQDAGTAIRITADPKATQPRADLRLIGSTRVDQQLRVDTTADGARLSIGGQGAPWFRWNAGEITVVLPPDLARRLTVTTTQKAGIVSTQTDLDQLVAHNVNGVVRLDATARRVDVDIRNGSVVTETPISVTEFFSATSVNGDIDVEFKGAPPRTIEASTRNGDVTIGLAGPGPFLVTANTAEERGATVVNVPQTTNPTTATAQVTVRSETGDVTVEGSH